MVAKKQIYTHWLMRILVIFSGLIFLLSFFWPSQVTAQNANKAFWLSIDGVIGPASHDYLKRGFKKAIEKNAQLIIIQMDTPGGLDMSIRTIIRDIIASPIPVVSFVSPSGSRVESGGTYILYASHVAAMAPTTNLGAPTPVQISGYFSNSLVDNNPSDINGQNKLSQNQATAKKVNDAIAYIHRLAQMHGRNPDWVEQGVREVASLTAKEAVYEGVIDLIATSIPDLLSKIDGRVISVMGQETTLSTKNITLQRLEQDWRTRLMTVITDPNIAYILLLLGIYALIFEFSNPGIIFSGVTGIVFLLLALFAFQVLPINYAGLALIFLGIAFMLGEVFLPSFGALGIGGVMAFVSGSVMLMDTDIPGYGISIPVIATFTLLSIIFLMLILGMVIKARQRPIVSGMEQLIGNVGEVLGDFESNGWVRTHGERWEAQTDTPLKQGQKVRIHTVNGLILIVKPEESFFLQQTKED